MCATMFEFRRPSVSHVRTNACAVFVGATFVLLALAPAGLTREGVVGVMGDTSADDGSSGTTAGNGDHGRVGVGSYGGAALASEETVCEAGRGSVCDTSDSPNTRSGDGGTADNADDLVDTMADCWTRALTGSCSANGPSEAVLMAAQCPASCAKIM